MTITNTFNNITISVDLETKEACKYKNGNKYNKYTLVLQAGDEILTIPYCDSVNYFNNNLTPHCLLTCLYYVALYSIIMCDFYAGVTTGAEPESLDTDIESMVKAFDFFDNTNIDSYDLANQLEIYG